MNTSIATNTRYSIQYNFFEDYLDNIDFYNKAQSGITSTAHLRISNLPFISNHVTQGLIGISTSEQIAAWGELGDNQSTIFLYKTGGDNADFNTLRGNDWGGNMSVRGNFNYRVD